jgi:predicted HTH transcriptional regulator
MQGESAEPTEQDDSKLVTLQKRLEKIDKRPRDIRYTEDWMQNIDKRTYFLQNEILCPFEGETIEYKQYEGLSFSITPKLVLSLRRTICAFLNTKGGNIYIGVVDGIKEVVGIKLSDTDIDELHRTLVNLLEDAYPIFYPDINFLPIYGDSNQKIENLWVIKITVTQEEFKFLYSLEKNIFNVISELVLRINIFANQRRFGTY